MASSQGIESDEILTLGKADRGQIQAHLLGQAVESVERLGVKDG